MKYIVTADCTDLRQKFRKKGEIVNIPDGEPVPKWFEPAFKATEKAKPKEEQPSDLSKLNKQELMDIAGKEDVSVPLGATNYEIARLILADRRRKAQDKA